MMAIAIATTMKTGRLPPAKAINPTIHSLWPWTSMFNPR